MFALLVGPLGKILTVVIIIVSIWGHGYNTAFKKSQVSALREQARQQIAEIKLAKEIAAEDKRLLDVERGRATKANIKLEELSSALFKTNSKCSLPVDTLRLLKRYIGEEAATSSGNTERTTQ